MLFSSFARGIFNFCFNDYFYYMFFFNQIIFIFDYFLENLYICIIYFKTGSLPEWLKGVDCKSTGERLHRFKSYAAQSKLLVFLNLAFANYFYLEQPLDNNFRFQQHLHQLPSVRYYIQILLVFDPIHLLFLIGIL